MFLSRIEINIYRRETRKALDSPQVMHAAIMASFPSFGDKTEQRVLWRIDRLGPSTYVLVQSEIKPDFTHMVDQFGWPESGQTWETLDYDGFLSHISEGEIWRFRLTANPVRSVKQEGSSRGKIYAHVTVAQQEKWLSDKADKLGFSVKDSEGNQTFNVKERSTIAFNRGNCKVTVSYATFEGTLTVKDAELMRKTMKEGIGREKAYGCGLITLAR